MGYKNREFRELLNKIKRIPRALVVRFIGKLSVLLAKPASICGFTSSLYYTFLSTEFYREHKAVLRNTVHARGSELGPSAISGRLRRSIHRIEKGLVMVPRKSIFAEKYIEDTVGLLVLGLDASPVDEIMWAVDVLNEYFSVVERHSGNIKKAYERYEKIDVSACRFGVGEESYRVPSKSDRRGSISITLEELRCLYLRRRSVRWFLDKEVPEDVLDKAIDIAVLSPTACNRLPYRFVVINGNDAGEIASLAGGTSGFFQNIPCLIVVVGDLACFPYERDRHLIYIDASLASMQLMLALEVSGLSTCSINWPDVNVREVAMAERLGLGVGDRVVMLMAVGYADPDGLVPFSQKKYGDDIRSYYS